MTHDLLADVLAANAALALAVLAVLPFRPLMRPRLGARAVYALWAAPPLAALAVLVPHRATSDDAVAPFMAQASRAAASALPAAPTLHLLAPALVALWIAGALATALLLARRQSRFVRSLGPLTPVADDRRLVRAGRAGFGPALVGAFRPLIVTPADFEAHYAPAERALILAHERTHLACGDALVNAASCAVQCLGWFNPLAHLGVRRLRIDQELACDAAVIERFPKARQLYGELLLKTQLAHEALPLGCQWPAKGQHPLKERIAMLKSPLPPLGQRRAGLAVAALIGLAAGAWAWTASAEAPPAKLITHPVWIKKPTGADIDRLYPPGMAARHMTAQAAMTCRITGEGRLRDCKVGETRIEADSLTEPTDRKNFKRAMLELSKLFQMAPVSRDGVPTAGGTIILPVMWALPNAK